MARYFYKNFLLMVLADLLLIWVAWYGAHLLRFNFQIPDDQMVTVWRVFPLVWVLNLVWVFLFDLYRGMWRYTSLTDLGNVLKAVSVASACLMLVILFVHGFRGYSRSIFVLDWLLTVVGVGGLWGGGEGELFFS